MQGSLGSRLASDVFNSNRLWFHAYKRARRLAELGDASVAVGAFGRVVRAARSMNGAVWPGDGSVAALGTTVAAVLAVPHSRRYLARHAWCVISRHRLQRVCYEARLHTRAGRLPAICWIRPTKVGERAWILCRAGICADDFDAYKAEIAAACYAREARVARNKKWSQLLTLDIVRHDPLGTTRIVPSLIHAKTSTHQGEAAA